MGSWSYGILTCYENPIMCLWAFLVPCGICCMQIVDAKVSDKEKSAPLVAGVFICCLGCIGGTLNRLRLRSKLNVEDNPLFDVLFSCFLPCCAVTQEWRETMLKHKGDHKAPIWSVLN